MRGRIRFGGLAALAAVLVIAAIPAVGYSAGGKKHETPAETVAHELLGKLPLPMGAVEVSSSPSPNLSHPAESVGCQPLVDVYRFWYVSGEPRAVIAWIQARAPAGDSHGESSGPGGTVIFGTSSFGPDAKLVFGATLVKGGRTALRADAEVVPQGALCKKHGSPNTK